MKLLDKISDVLFNTTLKKLKLELAEAKKEQEELAKSVQLANENITKMLADLEESAAKFTVFSTNVNESIASLTKSVERYIDDGK